MIFAQSRTDGCNEKTFVEIGFGKIDKQIDIGFDFFQRQQFQLFVFHRNRQRLPLQTESLPHFRTVFHPRGQSRAQTVFAGFVRTENKNFVIPYFMLDGHKSSFKLFRCRNIFIVLPQRQTAIVNDSDNLNI